MWFETRGEESFPGHLCSLFDVWLYNRWGTPAARENITLDADVHFEYWNRTMDDGATDIGDAVNFII